VRERERDTREREARDREREARERERGERETTGYEPFELDASHWTIALCANRCVSKVNSQRFPLKSVNLMRVPT
jgi:hypothetical protein